MAGPPYSLRPESTPLRKKSQLGAENAVANRGAAEPFWRPARALLECYLLGLGSVTLSLLLHWVVDLPLLAGDRAGNADSFLYWIYEELRTGLVEEGAKFLVFCVCSRSPWTACCRPRPWPWPSPPWRTCSMASGSAVWGWC
jgi:hypothetical protein